MLRGAARYPIATTGTLMVVALCFGATLDDLINDIGGWISTFQTLIVGAFAIPTVFYGFKQIEQNRIDRQADRRFALATRFEAIKAIDAYANKTAVNIRMGAFGLRKMLALQVLPPTPAQTTQAQLAGAAIADKLARVDDAFAGKPVRPRLQFLGVLLTHSASRLSGLSAQDEEVLYALNDLKAACQEQVVELELMITGTA